jgi:micrococcal nuclease
VRRVAAWLLVLALALGAGGGVLATGGGGSEARQRTGAPRAPGDLTGRVVRVVDGDTIHVQVAGRREKVRYIGVDTPESVRPGTPVECFAKAASKLNASLVAGERVRLERDVSERDRYGRLLAYVHRVRDGLFVGAELVRRGYAHARRYPPDVRHAATFARLERVARQEGRGLWRTCTREGE